MGYKIGDTVRLRPGSQLCELLEPWDEATGQVVAVFDEMQPPRLNVRYGENGPLASTVPAAEFVRDRSLGDAPF